MRNYNIHNKLSQNEKEKFVMRCYEDLTRLSDNREPQRAYYIPYESLEKALAGKKEDSGILQTFERNVEICLF